MADLTILMLTPNRVPKKWAKFHKQKLLEAAGDNPIITISKEPLDWGVKNLIQDGYGISNLSRQILRGAQEATTEFIAIADDDTLYDKEHFAFRPRKPGFYYNHNRWHILTWGEPVYYCRPRSGNGCMIATRELVIQAITERLKADPELKGFPTELGTKYSMLQYDRVKRGTFTTEVPILSFTHELSVDEATRRHEKYMGKIRTDELPMWGKAKDIRKKFQ